MPNTNDRLHRLFTTLLGKKPYGRPAAPSPEADFGPPEYTETPAQPKAVDLTTVVHPDGRMSQYPPPEYWDDWVEWDGKAWPRRVGRRYMLVPTACFNCESACGLLAYIDRYRFQSISTEFPLLSFVV